MVNIGRPSRGCDPCRTRHTKCDERRPQCSRCQRAGRQCTGYKDAFDINHRNETNVVAKRVSAREAYLQHLPKSLPAPYEQQAIELFVENFVLASPDARYSKGHLAGLLALLQTTKSNSLLSSAVEAVGFCLLATSMADESIASRAARSYSRSLKNLRARLDLDADCTSSETMMSVYLMGLYEMIMPPKDTLHPWLAHLKGLTALAKAHSKQAGNSFPGAGFLIALNSSYGKSDWAMNHSTLVSGWFMDQSEHHERALCSEGVTLDTSRYSPVMNGQSIRAPLDDLVLRTTPILQAAPSSLLRSSHLGAKADVELLLAAARSQLSSFLSWPSSIPDYWQPRSVLCRVDEYETSRLDIFSGRVDIYSDLYVAAAWNTYRTTLLRLCDIINQCHQHLETNTAPFRETGENQTLRAIAARTGEGICASVPYHVNKDWLSHITNTNFPHSPKALGGLFLIWPLYGGSILSIVPKMQRAWMRQKLRSIGTSMGLAQAIILADTVDLRDDTDPLKPLVIAQGHAFMWSASMF